MDWLAAVPILVWIVCTLFTENKVTATALCPGRQVNCLADSCRVTTCFAFPQADCVADFCNGCNANFFMGNQPLSSAECGLSSPSSGFLRDDTENEGTRLSSSSGRLSAPSTQQRAASSSSGRRTLPSSQRNSGFSRRLTRWQQINSIRARRRQEARQQKLAQQQQQRQQRQRQNGSRTRQQSSRPSPRRSRKKTSQSRRDSNRRLGRRRPSSSSGFLARLLG